jgi:outer membrane immunogenic protein
MKSATTILTAATGLMLSGVTLQAADLLSDRAPLSTANVPQPPLWTGLYAGLNAGGTWDTTTATSIISGPFLINGAENLPWALSSAVAGPGGVSTRSDGFIGGGQLGFNFQYSSLLLGIEADIQGVAGGNNTVSAVTVAPTPLSAQGLNFVTTATSGKALDYFGTVRGRVGYLVTPTLLAYASGGLAYGRTVSTTSFTQSIPNDTPGFLFAGAGFGQSSDTRVGWTVGGGVEWMFWPNWSVKVEYQLYNLGKVAYPVGVTTDWYLSNVLAANAIQAHASFEGQIVRTGVNYHLDWGPTPVVAK